MDGFDRLPKTQQIIRQRLDVQFEVAYNLFVSHFDFVNNKHLWRNHFDTKNNINNNNNNNNNDDIEVIFKNARFPPPPKKKQQQIFHLPRIKSRVQTHHFPVKKSHPSRWKFVDENCATLVVFKARKGQRSVQPTEPRKNPYHIPLYWLFNRDPHNGLLYIYIITTKLGSIPSRELTSHSLEKENHLQKCLGKGFLSSHV